MTDMHDELLSFDSEYAKKVGVEPEKTLFCSDDRVVPEGIAKYARKVGIDISEASYFNSFYIQSVNQLLCHEVEFHCGDKFESYLISIGITAEPFYRGISVTLSESNGSHFERQKKIVAYEFKCNFPPEDVTPDSVHDRHYFNVIVHGDMHKIHPKAIGRVNIAFLKIVGMLSEHFEKQTLFKLSNPVEFRDIATAYSTDALAKL